VKVLEIKGKGKRKKRNKTGVVVFDRGFFPGIRQGSLEGDDEQYFSARFCYDLRNLNGNGTERDRP
jgi:hypothetical protein